MHYRFFLSKSTTQVKIELELKEKHVVENDTHPGSVRRLLLFSVMINDIVESIPFGMRRALFADDGALWKTVRINTSLGTSTLFLFSHKNKILVLGHVRQQRNTSAEYLTACSDCL